jgi:hypothetical protein
MKTAFGVPKSKLSRRTINSLMRQELTADKSGPMMPLDNAQKVSRALLSGKLGAEVKEKKRNIIP